VVQDIPKTRTVSSGVSVDEFVEEGTAKAGSQYAGFSYGWRHGRDLALGGTVKAVRDVLDTEDAFAAMADLGAVYRIDSEWRIGASLQNLGAPARYLDRSVRTPALARLGAAYQRDDWLSAEGGALLDFAGEHELMGGAEVNWERRAFLRCGYRYRLEGTELGILAGASLGVGFKAGPLSADYAYLPFGELGDTHRFALSWNFAGRTPAKKQPPLSSRRFRWSAK
jgi:hypothetical protein